MAPPRPHMDQSRPANPRTRTTLRHHHLRRSRPAHAPLRTHPTRTRPPRPPMKQPCLNCGTPGTRNRCERCHTTHRQTINARQHAQRKANGGRPQYAGNWQATSRAIRATATRCWLCGEGPRPNDPWQADHTIPAAHGGHHSPAAPAHRSCNIARSNKLRGGGTR